MAIAAELIRRKRDGGTLAPEEIRELIAAYTRGELPDYQASALLMAIYFRGLEAHELDAWTDAMLHSGEVLDLSSLPGVKVDKHSTGGVGDMISLALAPLAAACGAVVPMISGRGLGHTGGTLDKLEAIPGMRVDLSVDRFRAQLGGIGVAMIGQTERLAPADRRLYALRDVTGTVESIPLIASSIMSKKLASGIDALVLDVKVGSGAFMKTRERARELAATMCAIGRAAGKRVTAFLTDMDQPLGRWIGNAHEVREAIAQLRGQGEPDIRELVLTLTAEMLVLAHLAGDAAAARQRLERAIADGSALARFAAMVEAQGGSARSVFEEELPMAPDHLEVVAPAERGGGVVQAIDAEAIGMAALALGAGRLRKEDSIDPAVGLWLHKKVGETVEPGEPLVRIDHRGGRGVEEARRRILGAYRWGQPAAGGGVKAPSDLIFEVMR
ncbi:MAG TPA: thymidine phosphorylase [Polyangia bacterium]|nr:thymidine phosphorylase [Polyangia bacterium]